MLNISLKALECDFVMVPSVLGDGANESYRSNGSYVAYGPGKQSIAGAVHGLIAGETKHENYEKNGIGQGCPKYAQRLSRMPELSDWSDWSDLSD